MADIQVRNKFNIAMKEYVPDDVIIYTDDNEHLEQLLSNDNFLRNNKVDKATIQMAEYYVGGEKLEYPVTVNIEADGAPVVAEDDKGTHFIYTRAFSDERPYLRPIDELAASEREDFEALVNEVDAGKIKLKDIEPGANKTTVENSLTSTSTANALSAAQGKALNDGKVDKVKDKQLSTEDFTTALKNKLDDIDTGANNYTHPTTAGSKHIPSGGSSGQILRWNADGEAVWGEDNNTTYSNATQSATGLMSATDKSKLNGIETKANKTTIENALTSTSETNALSAAQGKVLNDRKVDKTMAVMYSIGGVARFRSHLYITKNPKCYIKTPKIFLKNPCIVALPI